MNIFELQDQDLAGWDEYVQRSPQATVYHLAGWKEVMEGNFRAQAHFLLARQGDQIAGILPLLHIKSALSGHHFTSMPGAICADDEEAAAALLEHATKLVKAEGARYLILRDSGCRWSLPGLVTSEDQVTLVVKLSSEPQQLQRQLARKVRQLTNKAVRAGLEVLSGAEHLDAFYPAYSRSMHDLGTPTLALGFFRHLLRQFPDHFTVFMVHREGEILGGGLVAFFRNAVYNTWGGMLHSSYHLSPNYLLYWRILEYACEKGFEWLDMGRSGANSGTFEFKKHWAAEPRPLYEQYYLNGARRPPPVGSARATDVTYRVFRGVWRHLPVAMTDFLGPRLRREMPFG